MDGRTTDSSPASVPDDPQLVLQQLIRQAQAGALTLPSIPHRSSQHEPSGSEDGDGTSEDVEEGSDDESVSSASDVSETSTAAAPSDGLLPYTELSSIIASITSDRSELTALLSQRKHLATAHHRNLKHQKSLSRSRSLLAKTRQELKSALASLDVADIVDAEDQSLEVIRTHKIAEDAAATCPLPATMVQQIPLLRLQSIERAEYDNALGSKVWLEVEDEQIRAGARAAALKEYAIGLSMDPAFRGDPLAEAGKMDQEAALRLAEEIEERVQRKIGGKQGGLDWATIAGRVINRSIEEVRTRWHGVLKPSVNTTVWTQDEIDELVRIATPHITAFLNQTYAQATTSTSGSAESFSLSQGGPSNAPTPLIPWQSIAATLSTGRTAYACFSTYCNALVHRDQPDMTSSEDETIRQLFSLFGGAWRFIGLHTAIASPNLALSSPLSSLSLRPFTVLGKVGRDPQHIYRRFRNTLDPALATGKWTPSEDALLISAVQSIAQTDNWTAIAARVPGRTSSQCRERWNRRLKKLVSETEEGGAVMSEAQVHKLREERKGQKKVKWTPEMDRILLQYVDRERGWTRKVGMTFGGIAEAVGGEAGMLLTDKNVRDRIVSLSGERGKRSQKKGESAGPSNHGLSPDWEQLQDHDMGDAEATTAVMNGQGGEEEEAAAAAAESSLENTTRPRTAIVPGAKRRKL